MIVARPVPSVTVSAATVPLLARRNDPPFDAVKLTATPDWAIGLLFAALSFLPLLTAAKTVGPNAMASVWWLVLAYFLLDAVEWNDFTTKANPGRVVRQAVPGCETGKVSTCGAAQPQSQRAALQQSPPVMSET